MKLELTFQTGQIEKGREALMRIKEDNEYKWVTVKCNEDGDIEVQCVGVRGIFLTVDKGVKFAYLPKRGKR